MPKLGNWITIGDPVGSGGQGTAYRAIRCDKVIIKDGDWDLAIGRAWRYLVNNSNKVTREAKNNADVKPDMQGDLADFIAEYKSDIRAIKVLHQGGTSAHDISRLKQEITVLKSVQHPSIQPIHDANLNEGWYVTDFYVSGSLYDVKNAMRYNGQPLLTLKAILPLVQALRIMHDTNIIHRDIKTQNIYVKNESELILGDLGLVFDQDSLTRITLSLETVGSRDWMPPWLVGERLRSENIQPFFDMVGIAKVIYCLIAGEKTLPLLKTHRCKSPHQAPVDLERKYPGNPAMKVINQLLDGCIVMTDSDCKLRTAEQMIAAIAAAIELLESKDRFQSVP